MEINGKCPKCGKPVQIHEFPGNVVFVVDGEVTRVCLECETVLIYGQVVGMEIHIEQPK